MKQREVSRTAIAAALATAMVRLGGLCAEAATAATIETYENREPITLTATPLGGLLVTTLGLNYVTVRAGFRPVSVPFGKIDALMPSSGGAFVPQEIQNFPTGSLQGNLVFGAFGQIYGASTSRAMTPRAIPTSAPSCSR